MTDWGGSMGKWGGVTSREKWHSQGYQSQSKEFIKGVKDDLVQWGYSGQHTKEATEGISAADVKWLLQYVGRVTDEQIRAGLQAAGATPTEVESFAGGIGERINQMKRLRARLPRARQSSSSAEV